MKKFSDFVMKKRIGGICQEGTRNRDFLTTPLLPFKKGFLFVQDDCKCDTVCLLFRDTGLLFTPKGEALQGNVLVYPFLVKWKDVQAMDHNERLQ